MNRAKSSVVALPMLLIALVVLTLGVLAQNRQRDLRRRTAPVVTPTHFKPLQLGPNGELPRSITKRNYDRNKLKPTRIAKWRSAQRKRTKAVGDGNVNRQTILLTPQYTPSTTGGLPTIAPTISSPSLDQHPFYDQLETNIYFDSNRVSDQSTVAGTNFNIFRSNLDGTGVQQIIGGSDNKLFPATSPSVTRLAYVSGGNYPDFSTGLTTPRTSGYNLFVYDLRTNTVFAQLTNRQDQPNFQFTDVRHPTWSQSEQSIAFDGLKVGDTSYHIYVVPVLSPDRIYQVTSGPSNDYSPAWSPTLPSGAEVIAYTSNASGWQGTGVPTVSSGVNPYDNIWVVSSSVTQPRPTRVTFAQPTGQFPGAPTSSSRNPAWSTLRTDPFGVVPPGTDPVGNTQVNSKPLLAFASNRNSPNNHFDIFYVQAQITLTLQNVGTVNPPEGAGNPAFLLPTSTTQQGIDATEPSYNFDPSNTLSNEDYPSWPQYINTYRIAFQSDRGANLDIYASTIFDIYAPTLLKYDPANNIIVWTGPGNSTSTNAADSRRQFNPGEPVRFRVRAADYETGVSAVYLQIKSPESETRSDDHLEHKIYEDFTVGMDGTIVVLDVPFEFDYQAVKANATVSGNGTGATFKVRNNTNPPGLSLGPNYPQPNIYIPAISDIPAFSGGDNPPDSPELDNSIIPDQQGGFWLHLYDDGPASAGGHEPDGETANDGVYTTVWTTPTGYRSDWLLDVILYDNAIDPFTGAYSNWKIYDNVWGLTNRPFEGRGGVLYVSDYDCGQKFLDGRVGTSVGQGSFYPGVPVESWMTEVPPSLFPNTYINGTTAGAVRNVLTPLGLNSYGGGDSFARDPLARDGSAEPVLGRYDIWRIACRGPITPDVLNAYRPTTVTQPPAPGTTTPIIKTVAERCVIWHNPYTGQLFTGPGTLREQGTQDLLTTFLAAGGRLFVNGEDIVQGLSFSGAQPTAFLTNILKAQYVRDFLFGGPAEATVPVITGSDEPAGNVFTPYNLGGNEGDADRGAHPIGHEPWYRTQLFFGQSHYYAGAFGGTPPGPLYGNPASKGNSVFIAGVGANPYGYHAFNQLDNDVWTSLLKPQLTQGGGTYLRDTAGIDLNYNAPVGTPNTAALHWYRDTTNGSKVVFSSIGLEGIYKDYFFDNGNPPTMYLINREVQVMTNILDWLRTGRIVGRVTVVNASGTQSPAQNVLVVAQDIRRPIANPDNYQYPVVGTARTDTQGNYVIAGLDSWGTYLVQGFGPGLARAAIGNQQATFHGGYQGTANFSLIQQEPGSIGGFVRAQNGQGVSGIVVVATDISEPGNPNPPTYRATTTQDGSYLIVGTPISQYRVELQLPLPDQFPSYTKVFKDPVDLTIDGPAPLTGTANKRGADFTLTAAPGTVTGGVYVADTNNNLTSTFVPGATVTATGNGLATPATAQTDTNGQYSLSLQPGQYSLTAAAPGYASLDPVIVVVTSKGTITQNLGVRPLPPGSLSGEVTTSAPSSRPIDGVTVTLTLSNGTVLTTTTTSVQTASKLVAGGGDTPVTITYNYRFDNVPSGSSVTVSARRDGFQPDPAPSQTYTIVTGRETANVNFVLDPLFTFASDLSLVSSPYLFTDSIVSLFGITSSEVNTTFRFVGWNADTQQYVYYPQITNFVLGQGYFLQNAQTNGTPGQTVLALTRLGPTAPTNDNQPKNNNNTYLPFPIPLKKGWNLIGHPYTLPVDFLRLQITDADGSLIDVGTALQQTNGPISGKLYTYENGQYEVVYTMDPFRGYFLFANRNCTLQVQPGAQISKAVLSKPKRSVSDIAFQGMEGGWHLILNAKMGDKLGSNGYLGTSRAASDKYDANKAQTPPAATKDWVTLTFDHDDWGDKKGRYTLDVRSPHATTWDFTVRTNVATAPVTLSWPNIATTPRKHTFVLTDMDTRATYNIRNLGNLLVPGGSGVMERHFRLEVQQAQQPLLRVMNVVARLNSGTRATNGQPVNRSVNVDFTTTAEATSTITVLANGRPIRAIEQGKTRAAGANTILWDLRNETGQPVTTGTYIVSLRMTDSKGNVVTRQTNVVVNR